MPTLEADFCKRGILLSPGKIIMALRNPSNQFDSLDLTGRDDISEDNLKNIILAAFGKVNKLMLRGTNFTDSCANSILKNYDPKSSVDLRFIDLIDTKVTHQGIESLLQLPRLENIAFESIDFSKVKADRDTWSDAVSNMELTLTGDLLNVAGTGFERVKAIFQSRRDNAIAKGETVYKEKFPFDDDFSKIGKQRSSKGAFLVAMDDDQQPSSSSASAFAATPTFAEARRAQASSKDPRLLLPFEDDIVTTYNPIALKADFCKKGKSPLSIEEIIEALTNPSNQFDSLDLTRRRDISEDDLKQIIKIALTFGKVNKLMLRGTNFTDSCAELILREHNSRQYSSLHGGSIVDLRFIDLAYTKVTHQGIESLLQLPRLENISFESVDFSKANRGIWLNTLSSNRQLTLTGNFSNIDADPIYADFVAISKIVNARKGSIIARDKAVYEKGLPFDDLSVMESKYIKIKAEQSSPFLLAMDDVQQPSTSAAIADPASTSATSAADDSPTSKGFLLPYEDDDIVSAPSSALVNQVTSGDVKDVSAKLSPSQQVDAATLLAQKAEADYTLSITKEQLAAKLRSEGGLRDNIRSFAEAINKLHVSFSMLTKDYKRRVNFDYPGDELSRESFYGVIWNYDYGQTSKLALTDEEKFVFLNAVSMEDGYIQRQLFQGRGKEELLPYFSPHSTNNNEQFKEEFSKKISNIFKDDFSCERIINLTKEIARDLEKEDKTPSARVCVREVNRIMGGLRGLPL